MPIQTYDFQRFKQPPRAPIDTEARNAHLVFFLGALGVLGGEIFDLRNKAMKRAAFFEIYQPIFYYLT